MPHIDAASAGEVRRAKDSFSQPVAPRHSPPESSPLTPEVISALHRIRRALLRLQGSRRFAVPK